MDDSVPTLPNYGKPMPVNPVPVLENSKSQAPLVALTKKMFNKKLLKMPKLKGKIPDPFKKRKRARIV